MFRAGDIVCILQGDKPVCGQWGTLSPLGLSTTATCSRFRHRRLDARARGAPLFRHMLRRPLLQVLSSCRRCARFLVSLEVKGAGFFQALRVARTQFVGARVGDGCWRSGWRGRRVHLQCAQPT